MKELKTHLTAALEKLSDKQVRAVKDSKARAMAGAVAEALRSFCRQEAEFAQAVDQGGNFTDCMAAVAKGVGDAISDIDAYKKAVGFYFPGAKIQVQMTIDLIGDAAKAEPVEEQAPALQVVKPAGPFVLDLDDFL